MGEVAGITQHTPSKLIMPARFRSPRSRSRYKWSRLWDNSSVEECTVIAIDAPCRRVEEFAWQGLEQPVALPFGLVVG